LADSLIEKGKRFVAELFGSWWGRCWVGLAAISTLSTFIPLFVRGFTLPRWILFVVSVAAWIIAPFDLYRKKLNEIDGLKAQLRAVPTRRSRLVLHSQERCRFYRQVDPNDRTRVLGVYFEICLAIENTGNRNSVINRYDLEIQESGRRYPGLHLQPRNSIQARNAQYAGLRQDFFNVGDVIRVPPEDAIGPGVLPLWISENVSEIATLTCRLTITDTEGSTATADFVVSEPS
jgi:hypothetical protein